MKEGLEADHVKRHRDEMRKMREGVEADHEKRMREAVEWARAKIFSNTSAGGTNDTVPELSIPIPISESFDEKNTGMTGIEYEDKDREEQKMRRAMREEVAKISRDEF